MSALRAFAIILSLTIISTSSAPQGIAVGIKSKVYFGNDKGFQLPNFQITIPGLNLKPPPSNPPRGPFKIPDVSRGMKIAKQQPQFMMPQQVMDMMIGFIKMLINSGMTNQALQPIMG